MASMQVFDTADSIVPAASACFAQSSWKFAILARVARRSFCSRYSSSQIASQLQSAPIEHPLQRHRKIATALAVLQPTRTRETSRERIAVRIEPLKREYNVQLVSLEVIREISSRTLQRPTRIPQKM